MSEQSGVRYFIRMRGRVTGPHGLEELQRMAGQGTLTRMHQLSRDGEIWHAAASMKQLFPQAKANPPTRRRPDLPPTPNPGQTDVVDLAAPAARPAPSPQPGSSAAGRSAQNRPNDPPIWHYAINDEEFGPAPVSVVVQLIRSQRLHPDDLVWRHGLEQWRRVRETELASLAGLPIDAQPGSALAWPADPAGRLQRVLGLVAAVALAAGVAAPAVDLAGEGQLSYFTSAGLYAWILCALAAVAVVLTLVGRIILLPAPGLGAIATLGLSYYSIKTSAERPDSGEQIIGHNAIADVFAQLAQPTEVQFLWAWAVLLAAAALLTLTPIFRTPR